MDGLKDNLALTGEQCSLSWGSKTAEWRVDLGEILSIHHIVIQYMTDNREWGNVCFMKCILIMCATNTKQYRWENIRKI